MTGTQLQAQVESYLNAPLEPGAILPVVNECLNTIGDMAQHFKTKTITTTASTWEDLDEGTTAIIEVYRLDVPYTEWKIRGLRKIAFKDAGTYEILIRTVPPSLLDIANKIEIHPLFEPALLAYVRGFMKLVSDDESNDGRAQMELFASLAERSYATLVQIRRR